MKRFVYILSISLLSQVFWGCFGNAPVSRFYLLDYVPTSHELITNKAHPYTIRIKDFTIAEAYERPQIVYRKSAHELRFYNFHQWAVKPEHLLSDMIFKHIRTSGIFQNTIKSVIDTKPDYTLAGQIIAIEEYDNEETWYAHLAITFQLENSDTKKIVWQNSYDVRKVVSQHEPVYVVRELSFLLENTMDKVVQELNDLFLQKSGINTKSQPEAAAAPALPDPNVAPTAKPNQTAPDSNTNLINKEP